MKELLIIRSVSFQQLDLNLSYIQRQYPNHKISLLTHEHGVKLAQKYKDIDSIYVYPYKEGFKYGNKVLDLENKNFDIVVVPVTNISGVGFFNVLRFSKMIKAKKRVMCNVVSDLKEISDFKIMPMELKNFLFRGVSFILTFIFSIFMIIFLPLKLKSLIKKE
ncbi:MAG: glycosyltransferase family 9 protein [Clostridium lundense]|nr:glycosyltransferase family 9 protein [Clostridium lundense]